MSFPPPPNPHVRPSAGPPAAIYTRPSAPSPDPVSRRWGLRLGLVAGLLVAVGAAGAVLRAQYLPSGYVVPGLAIDGERVPEDADAAKVRAFVEARAASL